jgi:hypothetical protein
MYIDDGNKTLRRNVILYLPYYTTFVPECIIFQVTGMRTLSYRRIFLQVSCCCLFFLMGLKVVYIATHLEGRHCLLCYILKNKPLKQLCFAELTSSPAKRCNLYSNSYLCVLKKMKYVHSQEAKWNVLRSLCKISSRWELCELPKQRYVYWAFLLQISNYVIDFYEPSYFTPFSPQWRNRP